MVACMLIVNGRGGYRGGGLGGLDPPLLLRLIVSSNVRLSDLPDTP